MILDVVVFGVMAWLAGCLVRIALFKSEPAPGWLAWLSSIAVGALALVALHWGQVEAVRQHLQALFGTEGPFRVQPRLPIAAAVGIATIWFLALRRHLRFPWFRRSTETASPSPPAPGINTPRPFKMPRWIMIGGGVLAVCVLAVLYNPVAGPLSRTRADCLSQQMRGVSTSAEYAAAEATCAGVRTETELRCHFPFRGDASQVEATLYERRYGPWEVEMYHPYPGVRIGRFTVRLRFRDNSTRHYDVALSEPLSARQAVSGFFEPLGADRQKDVVAWDFVNLRTCWP